MPITKVNLNFSLEGDLQPFIVSCIIIAGGEVIDLRMYIITAESKDDAEEKAVELCSKVLFLPNSGIINEYVAEAVPLIPMLMGYADSKG